MTDEQRHEVVEAIYPSSSETPQSNQLALLKKYGVLLMPAEISGDYWPTFVEAVLMHPDPIQLHCSGSGGSAFTLYQMIGLIRQHGQFIGVLHADAASAHSILFAACQTRYVSPLGSISVHCCVSSEGWQMSHRAAKGALERYQRMDRLHAEIMASACDAPYDTQFWLDTFNNAADGMKDFDAQQMIDMGMAKPIAEMGK